jgi:hypothetical protein
VIELELGERRERPSKEKCKNFNELKEKRTDEIAAKKAGFSNHVTYRQAKEVAGDGAPELILS